MNAPQFTPGPWRFRVRNAAYPNIADIETDAGYFDSELLAFTSAACDQSPANARLIAAAPELYEALTRCHALFIGDDTETPIAQMVDAALAKARGEQVPA